MLICWLQAALISLSVLLHDRRSSENAMRSQRGAQMDLKRAAEKVSNEEDDHQSEVETVPSSPSTGHSNSSPTSPARQSDSDSDCESDIESNSDGKPDSKTGSHQHEI